MARPIPLPEGEGLTVRGKPVDLNLLRLARALRGEQTNAERLLWQLLRNRRFCGLKFRRQHPFASYVLGFYCHEARLGIELDGGGHNDPEKKRQDKERTAFLENAGIKVIRFWNHDVLRETEAVLGQLYTVLASALSQEEKR